MLPKLYKVCQIILKNNHDSTNNYYQLLFSESKTVVVKEIKRKKSERTAYFTKNVNTMSNKTLLLDSLLNIVKNMKGGQNQNVEENQKNDSYYIIPLLFSTQEDFLPFLNSESK